jgi:HAD superfamily hydrolase (TIGR01549 family)
MIKAMKAILFDWDGTLVDSRQTVVEAYRSATNEVLAVEYPATPAEEESVLTGHSRVSLAEVAPDPEALERVLTALASAYLVATPALAFPGAAELLDELRGGGVAVGIVTSKIRGSFEHDAAALGLTDRIDAAIGGDDGYPPKPDPAPVLACLAALDIAPADALFVGDGPDDVTAGRAAGVRTVAALHGFAPETVLAAGPDRTVKSLGELRAVLAEELLG